jgi:PAS domain S-box-containing protein
MKASNPNISLEVLFNAVEIAASGIVIADCALPDMPLVYVNEAFTKITGYEREDIIGKNCRFLQSTNTTQENLSILRDAIKKGEKCKVVLENFKKNGDQFWNELSISPLFNNSGQLTHFIGVQDDITSKILAQDLKIQLINSKIANDQKTEFLNTVSHELRTPLTVMLGNIPMLTNADDMPPTEEIVEIAKDIEESGEHLLKLINEILDISRIDGGKLILNKESIYTQDIIEDVLHLTSKIGKNKGLIFKKNVANIEFLADKLRLKQILINVIGNAIKFTEKGTITITVFAENNNVIFEIEDTGIGIKPEHINTIFDVFVQVDGSATRTTGGSGLGLTITKKLVELHKGTITLESVYNQGSIFRIILPK